MGVDRQGWNVAALQRGLEFQCHLSGDLQQLFDKTDLSAKVLVQRGIVCSFSYLTSVLRRDVEQQDGTKDFFLGSRLHVDHAGAQLDLVGLPEVLRRQPCRCSRASLRSEANYI